MIVFERVIWRAVFGIFIAALGIISGVYFISCSSGEKPLFTDLEIKHSMTVQKFSGSNNSIAVVSGTAINKGNETMEVASVVVMFFDSDGKMIDKSSAIATNLQPGGTWNFSVQSSGPDSWKIVKYSLTSSSTK